jgi:hypothetical protein
MGDSTIQNALTTALAIAAEDPGVGVVELNKGWTAEVVTDSSRGRQLRVRKEGAAEVVLTRFDNAETRPLHYRPSIGFVASTVVWAGEQDGYSAAVWIKPQNPEEVAASVVTASVQTGWDLESSSQLALPKVKTVSLRKGIRRRAVSILFTNVALSEGDVKAGSIASS